MSGLLMKVTLELPETLGKLPEQERNGLIRAGVYQATRARILQLRDEITECKKQLRHFEHRYGMSLQRFEAEHLLLLDTLQAHEDYNDWFYWQSVLDDKMRLLAGIQKVTAD